MSSHRKPLGKGKGIDPMLHPLHPSVVGTSGSNSETSEVSPRSSFHEPDSPRASQDPFQSRQEHSRTGENLGVRHATTDPSSNRSSTVVGAETTEAGTTTIKPEYPKKRIIVCCDGTWNSGDVDGKSLTNVARIARCISDVDNWENPKAPGKKNYISQIVHYQPGVGIGTDKFVNIVDGATGRGISKGIREAYSFIAMNWSKRSGDDDEIVLIGFSRGAFTVRCVAQFMEEVGLLTQSGLRHLPRLFKMWKKIRSWDDKRGPNGLSKELEDRCEVLMEWGELKKGIKIDVCAVWDTVKAIGTPIIANIKKAHPKPRYRTVGSTIPTNIKLAVQALALDERRSNFAPMVWKNFVHGPLRQSSRVGPNAWATAPDQKAVQCWFSGTHSDVGGGNSDITLANISLAWMIGQLTDKIHFDLDNLWAITTTRTWSKPTPKEDPKEQPRDKCRIVATSAVSSDLLRSNDSWSSYFQRRLGGSLIRSPDDGEDYHFSVRIFDHIGIVKYATLHGDNKPGSLAGALSPISRALNPEEQERLLKPLDFEGQILSRWAKHEMCAHVNVKQARNSWDHIMSMTRTNKPESLKADASFEASIPPSAILSSFYSLAVRCRSSDPRDFTPFYTYCNSLAAQTTNPSFFEKVQAMVYKLSKSRSESIGTYQFQRHEPGDVENDVELVARRDDRGKPILIFTRIFPLILGRPHETPSECEKQESATLAKFRVPGCVKCEEIWSL